MSNVANPQTNLSVENVGSVEFIGSYGMYVWSQMDTNSSSSNSSAENFLFLPVTVVPETFPNEYCDFVFPVLIGLPNNSPLNKQWIDRVSNLFKPGCYLVCAHCPSVPKDQDVNVLFYRVNITTLFRRLNANLYFFMYSANTADKSFCISDFIHQIDDLELVKGYFYPHRISKKNMNSVVIQKSKTQLSDQDMDPQKSDPQCSNLNMLWKQYSSQPKRANESEIELMREYAARRVLKRYADLIELHSTYFPNMEHLRRSFVTEKPTNINEYFSERFNFFISQDSYAVIIDHNSQAANNNSNSDDQTFLRLIRPGAYLAIEGTPRYANLSQSATTILTRYIFLCRLSSYPLIIVQEGVKAFDVFYNNDGLDFTYIDILHPANLIHVDWYQLQVDLKLDEQVRQFKGHIMRHDEISDILVTFKMSQLEYDLDLASRLNILDLQEYQPGSGVVAADCPQTTEQPFLFNLQQVVYNYINNFCGQMEVIWNLYFQIELEHLRQIENHTVEANKTNPVYLYIKSFNCIYHWSQKSATNSTVQEQIGCQVTLSDVDISEMDLARAAWSRQQFDQLLPLYLGKMYPYQNSIKQWLLAETRKITSKTGYILRATTLTDKLIYRNNYYNTKTNSVNISGKKTMATSIGHEDGEKMPGCISQARNR